MSGAGHEDGDWENDEGYGPQGPQGPQDAQGPEDHQDGPRGPDSADAGSPGPGEDPPRIPLPRSSVEDTGRPLPETPEAAVVPLVLEHDVLRSLLGAWALAACAPEETLAVEEHLGECGACADEARRLREAVELLQRPEPLDLDPTLRTRVLEGCLDRRPPRIPVPGWAAAYDAETARLDALLQDFGDSEWHAPVRLRWFEGDEQTSRRTTVAGVIAHLLSVDGLVAVALGLDDPLTGEQKTPVAVAPDPASRTEAYWRASYFPPTRSVRVPWREQSHGIVRNVSFAGGGSGKLPISYGDFELPLRDAMLDRAFECWVHAGDIADAVDYPYQPPAPRHLHGMIDLAARMLPEALAARRQAGLAARTGRPATWSGRRTRPQPPPGDRGLRRRRVADPPGLPGRPPLSRPRGRPCGPGRGRVLPTCGGPRPPGGSGGRPGRRPGGDQGRTVRGGFAEPDVGAPSRFAASVRFWW